MPSDAYTLSKQQQVLAARERMLDTLSGEATEKMRADLDRAYFEHLRAVSSSGLKPVLVQRNHEDWFAAYLVQPVGDGGMRLLVLEDRWRITRVKVSATVLSVPLKAAESHKTVVGAQRRLREQIAELLSRAKRCRITKSRKGLKDRKSRKATAKSS